MNDRQAHHAGDVVAVIVQLGESADAARLQIGADAVDHVEEILPRDAITGHGVDEGRPQSMLRRVAVEGALQILTPARDGRGTIADGFRIA